MEEIKERLLRTYDPEDFLETLEITSDELLDRFEDKLINRLEYFAEELASEEEDEDEY
jgi:hypothetical protein